MQNGNQKPKQKERLRQRRRARGEPLVNPAHACNWRDGKRPQVNAYIRVNPDAAEGGTKCEN